VLPDGGRFCPAIVASATHPSSMLNTDSLIEASTTWPAAPPSDLWGWGGWGRELRRYWSEREDREVGEKRRAFLHTLVVANRPNQQMEIARFPPPCPPLPVQQRHHGPKGGVQPGQGVAQ
jgi:hypothetical protein